MKRKRIDCILIKSKSVTITTRFDTISNDSCVVKWVGPYTLRE